MVILLPMLILEGSAGCGVRSHSDSGSSDTSPIPRPDTPFHSERFRSNIVSSRSDLPPVSLPIARSARDDSTHSHGRRTSGRRSASSYHNPRLESYDQYPADFPRFSDSVRSDADSTRSDFPPDPPLFGSARSDAYSTPSDFPPNPPLFGSARYSWSHSHGRRTSGRRSASNYENPRLESYDQYLADLPRVSDSVRSDADSTRSDFPPDLPLFGSARYGSRHLRYHYAPGVLHVPESVRSDADSTQSDFPPDLRQIVTSRRRFIPVADNHGLRNRLPQRIANHLAGDECPICICKYENLAEIKTFDCTHSFHSACINTWLKEQTSCPVCRATIRAHDITQSPDILPHSVKKVSLAILLLLSLCLHEALGGACVSGRSGSFKAQLQDPQLPGRSSQRPSSISLAPQRRTCIIRRRSFKKLVHDLAGMSQDKNKVETRKAFMKIKEKGLLLHHLFKIDRRVLRKSHFVSKTSNTRFVRTLSFSTNGVVLNLLYIDLTSAQPPKILKAQDAINLPSIQTQIHIQNTHPNAHIIGIDLGVECMFATVAYNPDDPAHLQTLAVRTKSMTEPERLIRSGIQLMKPERLVGIERQCTKSADDWWPAFMKASVIAYDELHCHYGGKSYMKSETMGNKLPDNKKVIVAIGLGESETKNSRHIGFTRYLIRKLKPLGYTIVGVDEYYTSQKCPCCGGDVLAAENMVNILLSFLDIGQSPEYLLPPRRPMVKKSRGTR
ncbi:hypothetical protein SeLEV6574_g04542 [Synchytrium endobioticum]|uniref:RING-type domain-containing protein n=1 Tax=Synchytrium endobioticum TaxID=286115 RepID=A0A507CYT5_9FUNG|nr:hypothetical protein SeLEV6574_g04542 [Synchytrium endobioticum]